jgi:hypothetical protein
VLYVEKKCVVVSLRVRYQKDEHELYPVLGKLYEEGYKYSARGQENLFVLTEPLGESYVGEHLEKLLEYNEEVPYLQEKGYTVYWLQEDGTVVLDSECE